MKRKIVTAALAALCLFALPFTAWAEEPEAAELPEESLRIAFIDSGISTRHIDPAQVAEGVNFVFPDADTQDRVGHGTATAGLVLGSADQGVAGVCPEAVAVPLVVLDAYPSGVKENGGTDALCLAIHEAVARGCRIINVSLSAPGDTPELREAVAFAEEQGAVIVCSAGNEGEEAGICYPAAYETVISVGAADGTAAAHFSQNGADVLAAGIFLSAPTNRGGQRPAAVSGTSYACALVSGFCARLLLCYPELTPAELRSALYRLAEDVMEPGYDSRSGWGLLQTDAAIPQPFLDLREDWSAAGIRYAAEQGLMNGVGGGLFAPDALTTRAMLVTMLWRMEGSPAEEEELSFTDVGPDAWYAEAVRWAASAQLVSGYSPERFAPTDALTREQLAAILFRYAARKGLDTAADGAELSAFEDAGTVSPWAEEALCWVVRTGIVTGTGAQRLSPAAPATRAQVATILMRFAALEPSEKAPPEEEAAGENG